MNNENIPDDDTEEKGFQFRIYHAYLLSYIPIFFIGIYLATNPNLAFLESYLLEYQKYYELITNAIQIVLGLIIALIVFYLNKFHDYKRQFTLQYAKLTELVYKVKRKYQSSDIEKYKEIVDSADEYLEENEALDEYFGKQPKYAILSSVLTIFTVGAVLAGVIALDKSLTNFLFLVMAFGFSIWTFVLVWHLFEEKITEHDDEYKEASQMIALLKANFFD